MRRFPLSVFYTRNSWRFGLLLKMRCIFFTEQPYTDQGSTPGPPYAVSFFLQPAVWGFGSRLLVGQGFLCAKAGHSDQRFGIEILMPCANALCQNSRIRLSPNSGTVRRFPVLPTPCAKTAKSCAFCDSLPVLALELSTLFPNSAQAEFGGFG